MLVFVHRRNATVSGDFNALVLTLQRTLLQFLALRT